MHTFRLLDMAIEIAERKIIEKRPNREELLSIRNGDWQYEDLIGKISQKIKAIEKAYATSQLQEKPDQQQIENLLVALRKELYQ